MGNMPETKDQDQDHHAAEHERREYIRKTFGEDALIGLATDQPARNSRPLGQRVLADRRKARQQARRELNQAVMAEALQVEDKAAAYARVIENARNGHPSRPADLAAAAHHALDAGIVDPPSSIARLIGQAKRSRQYEPMGAA
jgi:hypothetical protein